MTDSNGHILLPDAGDCAFCDYLTGARPYTVLFRDALSAVLVTREQRGVSHLLVLPIRHVETILAISDEEAAAVMTRLRDCATVIDAADERPGISIWQNNGIPANQKVPHVHFHVAGTLPGGGTNFGPVAELSLEATDAIGNHLHPFIGNWGI